MYAVTISPMIELGLFEGKDLNYDGSYTYKDALLSIFTPGATWLIDICNIFTKQGNFFEFNHCFFFSGCSYQTNNKC